MTLEKRFDEKVEMIPDGCWVWLARCDRDGYGRIRIGKLMFRSHRVAWERKNGTIPDGMFVLHTCDNPYCVNPNHLFLGTQTENMKDKNGKGRGSRGIGRWSAKLSESNVLSIRADIRTQEEIAKDYGVNRATISDIQTKRTWRHL